MTSGVGGGPRRPETDASTWLGENRLVPLQCCGGIGIRLLPFHAPVAELGERDHVARHRTAHEVARAQHLIFAVEITDARLALQAEKAFDAVHHGDPDTF